MADNLWPADAVAGAPSYSGRELRQLHSPAFAGATTARPLGARSGVRPGTSTTTVTATSSQWTCQPFAGVIDVFAAAEAGPYTFSFDAATVGSVNAAHATLQRVDGLYVQVDDPAEGAGATPVIRLVYLANPSAGTGEPPASPPARSFLIAHIIVPASGGGAPTVAWVAPYSAAAGAPVWFNTKAQLDLWTDAPNHTAAYVLADGCTYRRIAGAWVGGYIDPATLTMGSGVSLGVGSKLLRDDNKAVLHLKLSRTAKLAGGGTEVLCTVPAALRPTTDTIIPVYITSGIGRGDGWAILTPAGVMTVFVFRDTSGVTGTVAISIDAAYVI